MTVIEQLKNQKSPIVIIGLGYVGLPLACLLASKYRVVGFDIHTKRIEELKTGIDRTHEILEKEKLLNPNLTYTNDPSVIKESPFIIVTVPTPIDSYNNPDLSPLYKASKTVGEYLCRGAIVVYESTVYPGCTENECRSTIEKYSSFTYKKDFHLAYSPERINPGDKVRTIEKILKVVSASSEESLAVVSEIYGSVITAGIFKAPSIATAEAAKIIENTQRDLNIALMNELAMIFDKFGLDTQDVLTCAKTKWNFLDFHPGLVGGHCIGVDPYYLTHMAEGLGIHPQVILAGRKVNDGMGSFVAEKIIKLILTQKNFPKSEITVGFCGVSFKENVSDLRNSKAMDIVASLEEFGVKVFCFDPICNPQEFQEHYHRKLHDWQDVPQCDAMIVTVKHDVFVKDLSLEKISEKLKPQSRILADIKGLYNKEKALELGLKVWRL